MYRKFCVFILLLSAIFIQDCALVSAAVSLPEDGVEINSTNFPDSNFQVYVSLSVDLDHDNYVSDSEFASVTSIDVHSMDISSLEGIEYFTSLEYLDCSENNLTELNLSSNTALKELSCDDNALTSLNVSECEDLLLLYCWENQLSTIDVSNNSKLYHFDCSGNQFTALDVTNNLELSYLRCDIMDIPTLDLSHNTSLDTLYILGSTVLSELDCSSSILTSLNIDDSTALTSLSVANKKLPALNLSTNSALTNAEISPQLINRPEISETSIDSYPYKVSFEALSTIFENFPEIADTFASRALSFDVVDESGNSLTVSADSEAIYFSAYPLRASYYYDTKATASGINPYMNVVMSFTSSESTIELDNDITVAITSPDSKVITLPSSGGKIDGVIVSISGSYTEQKIEADSGIENAELNASDDVWIL